MKVLTTQAEAEEEVSRLNQLNAGKNCVYLYCTSQCSASHGPRFIINYRHGTGPIEEDGLDRLGSPSTETTAAK